MWKNILEEGLAKEEFNLCARNSNAVSPLQHFMIWKHFLHGFEEHELKTVQANESDDLHELMELAGINTYQTDFLLLHFWLFLVFLLKLQ